MLIVKTPVSEDMGIDNNNLSGLETYPNCSNNAGLRYRNARDVLLWK